jgi:hypothetical protein
MNNGQSVAQLFTWMRQKMPAFYQIVRQSNVPLAAVDFGNILDKVTDLGSAYLQYDAQKDLLRLQVERARAGLPPLDTAAYTPGVNVGLTDSTTQDITRWILIGGGVLLAFVLLRR